MSKGFATIVLALALAVLPESAAGQQIGASMRIGEVAPQPSLIQSDGNSEDLSARIPAGWAFSTSGGEGGGAGSSVPAALVEGRTRVVEAPVGEVASTEETVTLTFVPL